MSKPKETVTNNDNDNDKSLEALVRYDPPIAFSKCIRPVANFLWKHKLCKTIHPLKLLAIYGGMGSVYLSLSKHQRFLRGSLIAAGALPVFGSALFMSMCLHMFSKNRKPALESAQDLLLERIKSGRASRKAAYDVFLPPSTIAPVAGMIFFPGALVSHTAYASIAAALSDGGILVVVISLEPVRFVADAHVNRQMALGAMKDVLANHDGLVVDEWVLAGHSAGAMTALNLGVENEENVIHPSISKIVVCGIGRNETGEGSLRTSSRPFQVLVVNGTEDVLLKMVTKKEHEDFVNHLLPRAESDDETNNLGRTKFVAIEGGSHAQFADYHSPMDGSPSISREDQQRIFIEAAADFLSK